MDNTVAQKPAFRALTREEFERLSFEERMDYLSRAMDDLRSRLEETRLRAAKLPK